MSEDPRAGLQRFGPGIYYDAEKDAIHLFADELVLEAGYVPTPANIETVVQAAREVFAETFPSAVIKEILKPTNDKSATSER